MMLEVKKKSLIFISFCLLLNIMADKGLKAQQNNKVLFIGNSYTGTNNLPQIVSDIALSTGDTLTFETYAPGGFGLLDHSSDTTVQNKIMIGNWDYVVLQGQSQEPIVSSRNFRKGANSLYNQIRKYNSCTVIMPYMTWGRKNGDASTCGSFPLMCTYESMDTTLRDKYLDLTRFFNGEVSPVSVVWKYLRQNHSTINLYQADGSHPSAAGSYAAACTFYTSIFKKDPALVTFNFGLNVAEADSIKKAAKIVVFDSLSRWDYKRKAFADFNYSIGSGINQVSFHPIVHEGVRQSYIWDFGDGDSSTAISPIHSYVSDGSYNVRLTTTNCDLQGTYTSTKDTVIEFCSHTPTITTTKAQLCYQDTLWTQTATSYQWLYGSQLLPEKNRYLADYQRYAISGFSVISTLNACSELSRVFKQTPRWSGYYFDILGDPCVGDTVAFAVLNAKDSLSGNETILWYKNDTLIVNHTNEDTLLIFTSGKYECKVIDSTSICPLDTTYGNITYSCNLVGLTKIKQKINSYKIFPNPSDGRINIESTSANFSAIEIYDVKGKLIYSNRSINAAKYYVDLSNRKGMYFVKIMSTEGIETFKLILK